MIRLSNRNWPIRELTDAYWFQEGPGIRNWQFTNSGIKLLNVANISKYGTIDLDKTDRYLSEEEVKSKYKHFLVDEGDLVIASSGISIVEDGLLRTRGAFINKQHLPLCMNTSTIRFKSKTGISDLRFLKFWLDSFEFRDQITKLVTGSAQQNFGPSHLNAIHITLPPFSEQKRIATILEKADRLRRLRRYALELSSTYLQSVFLEMFYKNADKEWSNVSIESLAKSQKNAIRTGPFGSQLLHSEFVNEGIAVLGIDNAVQNRFSWGGRRFITEEKYQQLKRYTVLPGDVIITIMGTPGRCAVIPDKFPLAINTKHLCCITLDQSQCLPDYLKSCFLMHPLVLRQLNVSERGAVMPGLNMEIIKELMVPLPPLSLQDNFVEIVRRFERIQVQQREAERQAEHLFQTLLHQAFQGELTSDLIEVPIPSIEIDIHQRNSHVGTPADIDLSAYQMALQLE